MKHFFLSILFLPLIPFANSKVLLNKTDAISINTPPPISDWDKMDLKGKVKTLDILSFVLAEDGRLQDPAGGEILTFNENGFISKEEIYGDISPISYTKRVYQYDTENKRTEGLVSIYEDGFINGETDSQKEVYVYDANGLLKNTSLYGADDSLISKTKYEYDVEGRTVKRVVTKESKVETTSWTYSDSKKIKTFVSTSSTYGAYQVIDFLDENGLTIRRTIYLQKGDKAYSEYKYETTKDAAGNWIEQKAQVHEISEDGSVSEWEYSHGTAREFTYY